MATNARARKITLEDLQADVAGILRELSASGAAVVVSADGEDIVIITPVDAVPSLTPAQTAKIREDIEAFERDGFSNLIDHDDVMRMFDEDAHDRDGV